jgi:hypothetical protein
MATNKQLKFFKGANAPAAPVAGMIWFCTTDRTIRVYTGSEWEKYSGLVNAEWVAVDKKLNITSANGTVTTLDLSDCASASDITTKLTTINNTLTSHDGRITAAQNAADAAAQAASVADGKAVQEAADRAAEITRVEGLISAEATTARAAEQANAAAAKAADDKAAAAQTYAEGVNTALGQEVERAEGVEKGLDDRLKLVEGAIGDGGSVADAIKNAIEALDTPEAGVKGDGTHVDVTVKQVNGVVTEVVVDESDIASAQALADEIANRGVAEQGLSNRIEDLAAAETGRVSVLEEKVNALTAATHFEGVVEFDPSAEGATTAGYDAGDFVIYGNKEYIFDGSKWIELGDTTDEQSRLSALEGLVGTTSVDAQIDAKIAALSDDDKSSEDENLVKVTVSQADGNVTGVSLDDTKLDQTISDLDGKISANTAAHEANAAAIKTLNETTIPGINGRLDGLDGDVDRIDGVLATLATSEAMTQLTNRVSANEAAIERLDGEQDAQDQAIAAADAKGAQGIADAAAALAEAQAKVKSVYGDADVNASTTDHEVSLSLNKATSVSKDDTKAITANAVYEHLYGNDDDIQGALCWVEFE